MRFGYYFPGRFHPPVPSLLTGQAHRRLAVAAEAAGFDALALDEHPAPPERFRVSGGHDSLDPFVGLAALASVTSRVKLLSYLAVLPYRNPFLLAKAVATLDVMSDGRALLGVGAGYLSGEFAALGVDRDERNALFDETLDVLPLAWSGEPVTYRGRHFHADQVRQYPTPVQRPGPPLWIGGNSALTRRRVAARAQGWMPMPLPRGPRSTKSVPPLETLDDLAMLLSELRKYAADIGRSEPIDVVHSSALAPQDVDELADWVGEAAGLGVTWLIVNGQGSTVEEAEEHIVAVGERIIAVHGEKS